MGPKILGAAPTQSHRTGQILNRGVVQTKAAEITEIVIIRHPANISIQIQIGWQALTVLPHEHPALVAQLLVIGQVVTRQLTRETIAQITELAAQHGAPLAHEAGGQRGIIIGGQIQVVRYAQVQTAPCGHAIGRQQETRFTLFAQREG